MQRFSLFFTGPRAVEVRTEDMPPLAADCVRVATLVSAISAGTELLLYRNQMPQGMALDATIEALAQEEIAYPMKYGYAAVGRVEAVGAEVDAAWRDRLVFAFQPHESHFDSRPTNLLPLPADIAPETAVLLPNMETAVSFMMDAQPMIGEQVAVFGQGVVGLLTTALLAQLPLASLVALDGYALRRDWSLRLGAHAALDPADAATPARLPALLMGERPYRGADLSLELSGSPAALQQAIDATGFGGRVLVGSWYGRKPTTLNLGGHFHRSHMRLISSQVSYIAPQWHGRFTKARRLQTAWNMLARHHPERLITHRFDIRQAAAAYALLDQRPGDALQVVLNYGSA